MNMYSVAKSISKELRAWSDDMIKPYSLDERIDYLQTEDYKVLKQNKYKQLIKEFKDIAEIEIDVREAYKEVCESRGYKNQDRLFEDTTSVHNQKGKELKPYLITIRPENQTLNHKDFKPKIMKYLERKMFDKEKDIFFSLEQTCEAHDKELGKGIHTHIIAWSDLPKSDLVKNSISTFNKICQPQGVHIRPITHMDRAMKYITGEEKGGKTEEEKKMKIKHSFGDTVWRDKNGLEPLYKPGFHTVPVAEATGGGETSTSSPPLENFIENREPFIVDLS